MSYRRVVTGHDAAGRSCVVVDEVIEAWEQENGFERITVWSDDSASLAPYARPAAGHTPRAYALPPGGSRMVIVRIPAWAELARRRAGAGAVADIDGDGFHVTATIDYVRILDGTVTMLLDTGRVELAAGDVVVQRATRHAWRSEHGFTMLGVAIDATGTVGTAGGR